MKHKHHSSHHPHHASHHDGHAMHHEDHNPHHEGHKASHHKGNEETHFGHSKEFAGMPQHVVMRPYPSGMSTDRHIDDTIHRIDSDNYHNRVTIKKNTPRSMY